MPITKYVKLTIGKRTVQVQRYDELPFSLNYSLEDAQNFQNKQSSNVVGLTLPATLVNEAAANNFRNPDSLDSTPDQQYRSEEPCSIEASGHEIFTGKAFLKEGSHDIAPIDYKFDLLGDNGDWITGMQESTLYDFLKQISFTFSKANIEASWSYDGTSEALPYVFAPVRYRFPFGGYNIVDNVNKPIDNNVAVDYMRPSLSIYWIIYWAFKSIGYKIESNFLDSSYFRRMVMPWTWGNFLDSDGTKLNVHKFLAKGTEAVHYRNTSGNKSGIVDLKVTNDSTNGGYDNNGDYTYAASTMTFTYNAPHFGPVQAHFSFDMQSEVDIDAHALGTPAQIEVRLQWRKNGVLFDGGTGDYNGNGNLIFKESTTTTQAKKTYFNIDTIFGKVDITNGDVVTGKVWVYSYASKINGAYVDAHFTVIDFQLDFFKIAPGGTIDFANYTGFQNYKFLDLLRGVVDLFNLQPNTDPVSKVVRFEPLHPYSLDDDPTNLNDGYFKNDFVEWNGKEDLSKQWVMENFSEYERELHFRFKDDSNDGILKVVQDRNILKLAQAKYVLPSRFKKGNKPYENRFFSPLMHFEADQWKSITGVSPQLPCIVPENVSNTSQSESSNTFLPKIAYYKGNVSGVGGWTWDDVNQTSLPFLFAVNYKSGGEADPILSYSDENIAGVLGRGLLSRFFLQRMAILRNGQWYNTWFRLKNSDVSGQLHREYKSYRGHRWELVQINGYKPLLEESTQCLIRRHEPVSQVDADNIFPTSSSILGTGLSGDFDTKYSALKCLTSDLPT